HGLKRQRGGEIAMGAAPEGDFRKAMRRRTGARVLYRGGDLRPPNALHRCRRGLPGGGARGRPSAALSSRTIYRRPCRGRRLGHSDRSLKLETARSKKRTGLVAKAAPQALAHAHL